MEDGPEIDRTAPGPAPRRPRDWVLGAASLLVALVCLGPAPFGMVVRDPPDFQMEWIWQALAGVGGLALIFHWSRRSSGRAPVRAATTAGGLGVLLSLLLPLDAYYENYADLPWVAVVLVGGFAAVGAWRARLRWVTVLIAAAVVAFVTGAAWPPSRAPWPRVARGGDISVTLSSPSRDGKMAFATFTVSGRTGEELAQRYDLETAELKGSAVWGALPVRAWHPRQWWPEEELPSGREVTLDTQFFPPWWLRSYDLTLVLRRWPRAPLLTYTLPVPRMDGRWKVEAKRGGITFGVREWRWTETTTQAPAVRCLALTTLFSQPTESRMSPRLRFTDERGKQLEANSSGGSGRGNSRRWTDEEEWELLLPEGGKQPREIRVEVYDLLGMARDEFVFRGVQSGRASKQ